jgi:hypothetical protein
MPPGRKSARSTKGAKTLSVRHLKPLMAAIKDVLDEKDPGGSIKRLRREYVAMEDCCCQEAHVIAVKPRK